MTKQVQRLDHVIIRFAGDSGDGMQLTGDRFTQETAIFGNDLSTLPNFPAEIRAPAGTLPGVSSFQLHFADHDILTPGDAPDVLVAMNPAALKANLKDLPRGARPHRQHRRVHQAQPDQGRLRDQPAGGRLAGRLPRCTPVPITSMTVKALEEFEHHPQGRRAGQEHVRARPAVLAVRPAGRGHAELPRGQVRTASRRSWQANVAAFQAGWNYGETTEAFSVRYEVKPATLAARHATGTSPATPRSPTASIAASQLAGLPLFLGSYPITPASDILHELAKHKQLRRAHVPGRRRDRRRRRRARRRRSAASLGGDHHVGPGHAAEGGDRSAWPCRWSCR